MASVADPERQSSIKRYIGASWSWGRDALARQNVGQTNARSQDLHPDLLWLGCREVFFDETVYLRAAVAGHDVSIRPGAVTGECAKRSLKMVEADLRNALDFGQQCGKLTSLC